jgi:hypothetical protein
MALQGTLYTAADPKTQAQSRMAFEGRGRD